MFASPLKIILKQINMKKITTTLAVMLISIVSNAQVFMGMSVSGPVAAFNAQLKTKGFTLDVLQTEGDLYVFTGTISTKDVEIVVITTPTSKLVKKLVVFYPKQESWYSLKSQFNDVVEVITKKYGKPDDNYAFFQTPYEEGDGYEMTAVGTENCFYLYAWKANANFPNQTIAVRIVKSKRVTLAYENDAMMAKAELEQEKIDENTY
jgi:hypothetical protein